MTLPCRCFSPTKEAQGAAPVAGTAIYRTTSARPWSECAGSQGRQNGTLYCATPLFRRRFEPTQHLYGRAASPPDLCQRFAPTLNIFALCATPPLCRRIAPTTDIFRRFVPPSIPVGDLALFASCWPLSAPRAVRHLCRRITPTPEYCRHLEEAVDPYRRITSSPSFVGA